MLFSDVEQSTLLLARLGRAYEQALDGSRTAQRAAWARFDGVEMGTEGDSFFVVFSAAEAAVAAAVEAQRALVARDWPEGGQVRVRMGIHTGSPRIFDDGYVGLDVHRAARIAAAAHGGQVVTSDATANLVARSLPAGVTLKDLGAHRLKDLNLPEHLYQLLIPGTPEQFPPLRSMGTISSLPTATTPLLGRDIEVAEVARLLRDQEVRLVSLTGPGGSGKTRLAVAAARAVAEGFPDGVFFVPLAAVTTAEVIWSSIAGAMDLPAGDGVLPALSAGVAGLRALLVLDNLEQIDGADTAVATLLREAPGVVVLATSRRPLHLTSEHQYAVAPLPLPAADTLEGAEASAAVQLFVDRARAVRASFALTADNAAEVSEICRRLDGLPLAIELAAARSKLLGPRALLGRLDQALDLRGTDADRPTRQQAMRDTIDWSYRALPAAQQALFRRVGVFAGGADLDALAAVYGVDTIGDRDLIDVVADLVDASLITVTEDDEGEPRFTMMETMRVFALDSLEHAGELSAARLRHATHFAGVAAQLDWRLTWATREHMIRCNRRFIREQNNFREALAWATSPTSRPAAPDAQAAEHGALGLALLVGLWGLWRQYDTAEARRWLEAVLECAGSDESAEFGQCLYAYAYTLMDQGDLSRAHEVAQSSLTMLRTLDTTELAWALVCLSDIESSLGHIDESRQISQEAAHLARGLGDHLLLGNALDRLAFLEGFKDNWEASLELLQDARLAYENGGLHYLPVVDHNIADAVWKLGRANQAHQLMSTQLKNEARDLRPVLLVWMVEEYAGVLADVGYAKFAAVLLAACGAARDRLGLRPDRWAERGIAEARTTAESALSATEWADAHARGQSMTVLDALAEAVAATTDLRI